MENQKQTADIVEKSKQHELAIAQLYAIYAKKLAGHEEFWQRLSAEEEGHAKTIEFLQARIAEGKATVKNDRFSPQVMAFLQDSVTEALEETKGNFSHKKALETALKAEKSLMEKRYFEIFQTEDEELNEAMSKLEKETEDHAKRVEAELAKENEFSKKFDRAE